MTSTSSPVLSTVPRDLTAGLVVFLVALPLCLGVAMASGAPPLSGLLAGIVGGILVGMISGSQTSVIGAIYDIATGQMEFLPHADACVEAPIHVSEKNSLNATPSK